MVQLFEFLHDPDEEKIQSKWEELQDARLKLLLAEYHKAAVNWEKQETPDGFVTDVLKRGFWTCWGNNKDVDVLVTGINPSFTGKLHEPFPLWQELWKPQNGIISIHLSVNAAAIIGILSYKL